MDTVEVKEDIKKEDVKTAETKEATTSADDVKKEQKTEAAADKASSKEDTKKDEVKKSEVKKEEKKEEKKPEVKNVEQPKAKDAKVTSKIKHFDTPVAIHRGPSKNTEVFTFVGNISVLEEVGEFSKVQYVVPGVGTAEGYTLTTNLK